MYWVIIILFAAEAAAAAIQPSYEILPPFEDYEAQESAVLPTYNIYPSLVTVTPKPVARYQNVVEVHKNYPSVVSVTPKPVLRLKNIENLIKSSASVGSNFGVHSKYVIPTTKYYGYKNVVPILHSSYHADSKGNYKFEYQTGNDISHQESGSLKNKNTISKTGAISYQSPEGKTISLNYIADENGYQASGKHFPTPPPIPEAILRSLKYNAEHRNHFSEEDDGQYHPELYESGDDDGQYHPERYEGKNDYYEPVGSGQNLILTYTLPDHLSKDSLRNRADYVVPRSIWFPK